jgi:hypothetical protein
VPIDAMDGSMGSEKGDGSNRNKMYAGIACCIILILVIVLGAGYGSGAFGKSGDEPAPVPAPGAAEPPTQAPEPDAPDVDDTATERVGAYTSYIATVSNDVEALEDPTSAEWTTVRFMANNDPAMLDPTDTSEENLARINQRYALLLLYFGSDQDAWVNQENWLNADECSWYGVTCGTPAAGTDMDTDIIEEQEARRRLQSDATVSVVDLEANGLLGRFPPDLALLTELAILKLGGNGLSGSLPASLSSMVSLTELVLANNDFTGMLADIDFSPLASLTRLDLRGNGFGGNIADSIYGLTELQALILDNNVLSGPISTNVANMGSLVRFTAGGNGLTGGVPAEFASLANLGTLLCLYCPFYLSFGMNLTYSGSLLSLHRNLVALQQ